MKRRFRPTIGGLVLENKGNSNNATTSSDSTTTQPTRRARFKPKVGIAAPVVQRSPGKTSNQTKVSAKVPSDAGQASTSTKTASSSVNKGGGSQRSANTSSGISPVNTDVGSRPSVSTNKLTITTTVHSQPSTGKQLTGASPFKGVAIQPSTNNTSTGTSPVNKNGAQQASVGTNRVTVTATVHSKPSTKTSSGPSLVNKDGGRQPSGGTNDDTVIASVGGELSTGGQQSTSSTSTSTLPVTKDGGSQASAGTTKDTVTTSVAGPSSAVIKTSTSTVHRNVGSKDISTPTAPVNIIATSQLSTSTETDTLPVNRNSDSQPSNGSGKDTVTAGDEISSGTNKGAVTTSASSQPSGGSTTDTQRTSSQNTVKPITTVPGQPVRRSRIRPRVGIVSTRTPVEKTKSSNETNVLPRLPTVTVASGVGQTSTSTSKETVKITNTGIQPLTGLVGITKTSTRNTTGSLETMGVQNQEPDTLKRTPSTRRSQITPKVSGKTSQAAVQKTVPIDQSTISTETPSVCISLDKGDIHSPLSSGKENLNESTSGFEKNTVSIVEQPLSSSNTEPESVTTVNSEKSSSIVNQRLSSTSRESENVNIASSEESLQYSRSIGDPLTASTSFVAQPSISTNTATQNVDSSGSEKSQSTSSPAPAQLTRRARFKPRVGIVGRPSISTQKSQGKSSAMNKPSPASSGTVVANDIGQNLAVRQRKSVSNETRSSQQNTASVSGRNIENEHSKSRTRIEQGDRSVSSINVIPKTIVGNENEGLIISDGEKQPGQVIPGQDARNVADQTTSLPCEKLSDKRLQTIVTENITSNVEQTENFGENSLSSDPKTLHDSLPDVVILPQDNEPVSRSIDSASPSCLPVLMEDSTILPQRNTTCDGLPSGLRVKDTHELLYNLESADDLLQTLLNAENLNSNYVFQRNSSAPMDTNRVSVDIDRVSMDTTTPDVRADPNTSILTPSPSRRENDVRISTQNNQAKTSLNQARIIPQSKQSSSNETRTPAQNNQAVTTSRLVTKRQRGRPKNKQRPQRFETSVLDISTIPIASNIEIEPGVCTCDDIDHPILELPVDLIQEDLTQNSPKASTSSEGLKQRFQQRRSGTVKLVLSRKRLESSDVDKDDGSSTAGGGRSTSGDRTSTSGDRTSTSGDPSSTPLDINTSQSTTTVKSREASRKARIEPNIQVRRKTSKSNDQKKLTGVSRIFASKGSKLDSQGSRDSGTVSIVPLLSTAQNQSRDTIQQDLSNDFQSENVVSGDVSESLSSVQDSRNTTAENATVIFDLEKSATVETESSLADDTGVHELSNDIQSELRSGDLGISDNIQDNAMRRNKVVSNSGHVNAFENESSLADTSVQDLSKDDQVVIVLEVTGTAQGYTNVVCESASTISSSDASRATEKHSSITDTSLTNECGTESVSERSNIQGNVDCVRKETNTTSSLQENSDAVQSQRNIVDANLLNNRTGDNPISDESTIESVLGDNNQVDELGQSSSEVIRTDNGRLKPSRLGTESLVSRNDTSLCKPRSTIEANRINIGQAKEVPKSCNGDSSTVNSRSEYVIHDPKSSTHIHDTSSNQPPSTIEGSLCNNEPSKMRDPKSLTRLHDVSFNAPETAFEPSLSSDVELNQSQSNTGDILTDRADTEPISSSQTQDISLRKADSVFGTSLTNDVDFNQSQSNTNDTSKDTNRPDPISSSPQIQDISFDIPESAIEAAIRNTNEPLPDIVECPECPELVLCLRTADGASINETAQNLSQTQPGTLEDNVARATRRASEEFEAQDLLNDMGGDKSQTSTREKGTNNETTIATNENNVDSGRPSSRKRGQIETASEKGDNSATSTATNEKDSEKQSSRKGGKISKSKQKEKANIETTSSEKGATSEISTTTNEKDSENQSSGKRGQTSKSRQKPKPNIQRKRKARGKIVDDDDESVGACSGNNGSAIQGDGNKSTHDKSGNDDLGVQEVSLGDTCVQDESLGDTAVQPDTTQGSTGLEVSLEGSTPEVPSDPIQDGSSNKSGSRKRQSKAVKPKIPAKRSRKKTVLQESETTEACDETEQGNMETPEGETSSRPATPTLQETEEASTSQKRKRGRSKNSKKTTETTNQTEATSVEETPSKKRKSQRGKAGGEQDAVVNIASMKMSEMISYNPMTNPMTSENENETQTPFLSGISSQSGQSETIVPATEDQPEENTGGEERTGVCAPRVTIDADGNIVLDEESLVIDSTPVPDNLDKEVVFENANQQYNAAHKRKNIDRWGKEETLYFYEVLSQIGTDFSLMAKLFPKRNRTELKRKFKREEKINRDLIDKALSQRIPLAASLFADCLEETEEEMERSLVVQTAETAAQA